MEIAAKIINMMVMQLLSSYRVREDLWEMNKGDILRASCRNHKDRRLQEDVICYPETSDNCWETLRTRMLESNIRQYGILFTDTWNMCNKWKAGIGNLLIVWYNLTHYSGRVTQICVFNTVKLGTSASSP